MGEEGAEDRRRREDRMVVQRGGCVCVSVGGWGCIVLTREGVTVSQQREGEGNSGKHP